MRGLSESLCFKCRGDNIGVQIGSCRVSLKPSECDKDETKFELYVERTVLPLNPYLQNHICLINQMYEKYKQFKRLPVILLVSRKVRCVDHHVENISKYFNRLNRFRVML